MKSKIAPFFVCFLLTGVFAAGCGTLELKGQVMYAQDATATQVEATFESRAATSTPVLRNLSPVNLPTAQSCQVSFFWGEMPGLCPGMLPTQVDGAFQVYDGGYMLWERATGAVYVLENGGRGVRIEERIAAEWPELSGGLTPPPNHVVPIRGFGRVWGHGNTVKAALGWPLGLEQAYTAQFQSAGENMANQYFYISIPNSQVIEFNSAGTWRVIR